MDYLNTESELIESLDYLTLPVKRSASFEKLRTLFRNFPKKSHFLKDFRKQVSHKTQTSHSLQSFNDSVILNTTKEEIIEYYAIVSSTEQAPPNKFLAFLQPKDIPSQIRDQSVIKITVKPKIAKPHKSNVFTRRTQNPKHIHSTVSDEDYSFQAKNVYLVVSGKKREKHFKIKTTESAKLLKDFNKLNDDISLEQVKNVKQVIHSLNMDKKRKKGGTVSKRTGSPSKTTKVAAKKEGKKEEKKEGKKEEKKEEKNIQTKQAQSIVRITGHIGLGNDNQLLMKCGVEGTQAPAEVKVKTYPCPYFLNPNTGTLQHTISQGTQIDFGCVEDTQRSNIPFYTENIACLCKNVNDANQFDNGYQSYNQTQRSLSPLVVITVYPNDERCENVKIFNQQTLTPQKNFYENNANVNCMQQINQIDMHNRDGNYDNESDKEFAESAEWRKTRPRSVSRILKENVVETKTARASRSRSPRSQSQSTSSSHNIKRQGSKKKDKSTTGSKAQKESNVVKALSGPKSPRNQSPTRSSVQNLKQNDVGNKNLPRKSKKEPKKINNEPKKNNNEPKNSKPHPKNINGSTPSSRSQSPSRNSNQNIKRQAVQKKRANEGESKQKNTKKVTKEEKVTKPVKLASAATNTDHAWTKKTLVDTFTKEIMGQMEMHKSYKHPQLNESQVTISIDGENENYDVLLQQGRMVTDVRVRKTVKGPRRRSYQESNDSNNDQSMINLFDVDNGPVPSFQSPPPTNTDKFDVPEIKVRDSIEIGHKRQHSPHTTMDHIELSVTPACIRDADSFAPVKHHKDDKCAVADPTRRDKEIRQLLGVDKHQRNGSPIPLRKKLQPGQHYHEETRNRKENNKHCFGIERVQTNEINFLMSSNKHSVGTQYEVLNIALGSPKKMILNRDVQVYLQVQKELNEQKPITLSRRQYHKVKSAIERSISKPPRSKLAKAKCSDVVFGVVRKKKIEPKKEDQREQIPNASIPKHLLASFATKDIVMFTNDFKKRKESARQSISSGDILRSHPEHLSGSSTKPAIGSSHSHSLQTIFRGFRKSCTPNLGTSTCSFFSGSSTGYSENSIKHFKVPFEKPRKPFFKRLMSCLVLRASTTSEVKITVAPKRKASCSSTVDSYYISTSLAAVEMSSSIYDTSESFYSNHSIIPVNSKVKRGFFGSVRSLLPYKRNNP